MIDERLKKKAALLVEKAKKKNLIRTYEDFCKSKNSDIYALSPEEVIYYTSKGKEGSK